MHKPHPGTRRTAFCHCLTLFAECMPEWLPRHQRTAHTHGFVIAGKVMRWPALLASQRPKPTCSLTFQSYQPSDWEAEWQQNIEEYQEKACKTMLAQSELVDTWMEPMNASFSRNVAASELPAMRNTKVKCVCDPGPVCCPPPMRAPLCSLQCGFATIQLCVNATVAG